MSLATLKNSFDTLLKSLNASAVTTKFSATVENAYEALVLANVMTEYTRVEGAINKFVSPTGGFLNQGPGKFKIEKSFKIDFANGKSFYFAADVEVFGLAAMNLNSPVGTLFEVDVVVIPEQSAQKVIRQFGGYPAPQHLHSVYECKFGQYYKSQLRELLGLRRHVSYLQGKSMTHALINNPTELFTFKVLNANPSIAVKMARPKNRNFFDSDTASLYDLQEIKVI